MLELHVSSAPSILKGDFPLNHDCILKVHYLQGSPLRFSYLTCRAQDSGSLVDYFSKLPIVSKVDIVPVEDF